MTMRYQVERHPNGMDWIVRDSSGRSAPLLYHSQAKADRVARNLNEAQ